MYGGLFALEFCLGPWALPSRPGLWQHRRLESIFRCLYSKLQLSSIYDVVASYSFHV